MNTTSETSVEDKIRNLKARLKAEHEMDQARNLAVNALCSPIHNSRSTNKSSMKLDGLGTPTRPRKQLELPVCAMMQPRIHDTEVDNKMKEIMKINGILTINGIKYFTDIKDLEQLGELGNGTCGHVVKMFHQASNTVLAVKQMRRSGNTDENKRIIMDLDVVFKSHDCPYIVRYLGCFITESDVWICMELMATCFDRLLKKYQVAVPEDILGKVTLATVKALNYLKESHGVIHRDVKPSNILLDEKGNVKLCDFGISGRLVDSKARTKNAGCAAYMAPERIEPPDPRKPDYDIRADVWSLGITLVELATGVFPYKDCKCDFEVLSRVLKEDPPSLPSDPIRFSPEFQNFVSSCLTKDFSHRPKYRKLLEHPFLKRYATKYVDVAGWYANAISNSNTGSTLFRFAPHALSSMSTKRQPPPPLPPTHHSRHTTSGLESIVLNGDQSSSYLSYRSSMESPAGVNGSNLSEWASHKFNANKHSDPTQSTLLSGRYLSETTYSPSNSNNYNNNFSLENTSPIVLSRFHHQNSELSSYPAVSPSHYRSASVSPSRRYFTESSTAKIMDDFRPSLTEDGNREESRSRFSSISSSYQRYHQLSSNVMDDAYRRSPPTVPSPAPPSPPPRLNRFSSSNGSSASNISLSSPYMFRRPSFVDSPDSPSNARKNFYENSPLMTRRHVLPQYPPQPPPRRGSDCSSVPGSPQHFLLRRNDLTRNTLPPNKFQFTPQPQRRAFYQINDL